MNAHFYITTEPASPITADELGVDIRSSSSAESDRRDRIVLAAARQVEIDTQRSLITRTITGKLDRWPCKEVIYLPYPPFGSVTSVKYFDTNGDEQTLDPSSYEAKVSGDEGRIVPVPGGSWPDVKSDKLETIEVVYTAGYGANASDVPADLREACIKMGVMMYTNGAIDSFMYQRLIQPRKAYFNFNDND